MINTNDNGFLVLGYYKNTSGNVGLLYKLDANGTVDTNFGSNGTVSFSYIEDSLHHNKYRIESSSTNNIFLVWSDYASIIPRLHLQKFNTAGKIDPNYGTNGELIINQVFGTIDSGIVRTSLATSDGGFLIIGQDEYYVGSYLALWKFTSAGILDVSFGIKGAIFDHSAIYPEKILNATTTRDGGIAVLGISFTNVGEVTVWKFDNQYRIQSNLGVNGVLTFPTDPIIQPTSLIETNNGSLIISSMDWSVGILSVVNPLYEIVPDYWQTGNSGWPGTVFHPKTPFIQNDAMYAMATTPDNGFIIGGGADYLPSDPSIKSGSPVVFWKFDSEFMLDNQFGYNGIYIDFSHDSSQSNNTRGYAEYKPMNLIKTSDDGIVAVCDSVINNIRKLVLWKFH